MGHRTLRRLGRHHSPGWVIAQWQPGTDASVHRHQHDEGRVRPDGSPRTGGTISLRVFHDDRHQAVNILKWCKDHFGDRLKRESFRDLFTETDYEAMMMAFVRRFSSSQINKHRQRFWQLVKFAKRRPFQVRLAFGPDEVRRFGGTEARREREMPTVGMIRKLLNSAGEHERLWIWMGMGMGFGNDDLSRARPIHFDRESYDMRRGKTRDRPLRSDEADGLGAP